MRTKSATCRNFVCSHFGRRLSGSPSSVCLHVTVRQQFTLARFSVLARYNRVIEPPCLCVLTDKWEELGVNKGYDLGELMYFEADVKIIPMNNSIYVDACYVTASEDSNSTQRYDVISNFG